MNMIIHSMAGQIAIGDSLRNPKFISGGRLRQFDLAAANPMWNQDGYDTMFYEADSYERYIRGYPNSSSADWGWIQHILASLTSTGRAVVVLDTGVASRGSESKGTKRERDIRAAMIEDNSLEGVILLPENLFYNTPAPGVLVCLNKQKGEDRQNRYILIDASREYEKGKPKNILTGQGAERVLSAFRDFKDVTGFSKVISLEEARDNDYDVSPSRHVIREAAISVPTIADALQALDDADRRIAAARANLNAVLGPIQTTQSERAQS
jgi:type I restriction enzyme M protein